MKKKQAKPARKSAPAAKSSPKSERAKAGQTGSSAPGKPTTGHAAKPGAKPAARTGKPAPAPNPAGAKSKSAKGAEAGGAKPFSAQSGPARPPKAAPRSGQTARPSASPPTKSPDLPERLAAAGPVPEDPGIRETPSPSERAGLDKVMASLSQILGGRDFMSDAELDALLDDKMASGEIPPSAALDPLDEAQSLVYEAWNTEGPRKAVLARRALELSEDCADAYLILAQEEAKTREAALQLYQRAYEAGRRALSPALFADAQGHFWGIMETRPYMRARLALAECLWDLGRKEEALGHLRELIRLNPADNQGVRYILLQCLLESGADEELGELLARYGKDASPEIAYTRALWQFRRAGRGKAADAALAEALRANPHVPAYLLKRKPLPARAPAAVAPGSPEAAGAYAAGALEAWHQTLGAVEWLAARS